MKMNRKLLIIVLVSLLFMAFTIPAMAAGKKPYTLGAVFSVTGRASFLGDPEKKTTQMVVDQINAAGGINGRPLEVIIYDDKSDDTEGRLLVTRLIKTDKVTAVFGPSLSGISLAVVDLAKKHKIPLVSCAASWKIVTNPTTKKERKWVFKVPQKDSHAVEKIYDFMKYKGITKIAIISVTTGFGASGREELIRLAPYYGMNIVADEKFGPKDADMTAQLTRIRGTGAQAIVGWSIGPTQVTYIRNWRDLGMTRMPFYQSHGFGSRKNIKLAAGAAEGVFCPLGATNIAKLLPEAHIQKKVAMKYNMDYEKKYGEPISTFGGHAWDALHLLAGALKEVGASKKRIRKYLEEKKDFVGQHGVFNFSPVDHNGLTKDAFEMVVVKGGDWALAR
jgi:branched-chain amino acid transport system substrate-binding protein